MSPIVLAFVACIGTQCEPVELRGFESVTQCQATAQQSIVTWVSQVIDATGADVKLPNGWQCHDGEGA